MNFRKLFLTILLIQYIRLEAQTFVDTSYTINGTYHKEVTKFPFIKIVQRPGNPATTVQKDVTYKSIGTRSLHLDVYFPIAGKQPAVVLIHGGGWKSGNKEQMHFLAQEIAARGYACFCVEYRLSGEAQYPAAVHDVKSAIKYIKANAAKFNADANRVAVLGCSSGGQMAALIGATNGNPEFEGRDDYRQDANVQAIIDMDGIVAFHHPESAEGKVAAQWLGGTYDEKPEVWNEASALTHASKDTPPIFFINSDKPRFHAGRDDMIAILDKHGIYSEVKSIDNSPHSFWFFDPWFDRIVAWSVQFLDKTLKNK
ncbi:MAG: alpha/beta fold hydrolase [Flavobacterium sp.]